MDHGWMDVQTRPQSEKFVFGMTSDPAVLDSSVEMLKGEQKHVVM